MYGPARREDAEHIIDQIKKALGNYGDMNLHRIVDIVFQSSGYLDELKKEINHGLIQDRKKLVDDDVCATFSVTEPFLLSSRHCRSCGCLSTQFLLCIRTGSLLLAHIVPTSKRLVFTVLPSIST